MSSTAERGSRGAVPPSGVRRAAPRLGPLTTVELGGRAPLLLVPLGSTEQHGPHLPLDTDTRLAVALAEATATRLAESGVDTVVAPALPYGASGEHAGFAGTLSIGQAALEAVLVEMARSADDFATVVFVCGHGGNFEPLQRAVAILEAEQRSALAWFPDVPGGDAHAGDTETSLMMHVAPELVRTSELAPGETAPLPELMGRLRRQGIAAVSPSGVLGDPTGASPDRGRQLFEVLVADLVTAIAEHGRAAR